MARPKVVRKEKSKSKDKSVTKPNTDKKVKKEVAKADNNNNKVEKPESIKEVIKQVSEPKPDVKTEPIKTEPIKTETETVKTEVMTENKPIEKAPEPKVVEIKTEQKEPFTAFGEDTYDKGYTKIKVDDNSVEMLTPIKERNFTKPTYKTLSQAHDEEFEELEELQSGQRNEPEQEAYKPDRGEITNPALGDLKPKNKKKSAEHLADVIINAYCMLNEYGKKWASFNEDKYQYKAVMGKFNMAILELELDMGEGQDSPTVRDFLLSLNLQSEEVFVVTDEFKEEAKELMVEIFVRRGWGLTPEQRLIILFFEDMMPKIQALISIKRTTNMIMKQGENMFKQQNLEQKQAITQAQKLAKKQADADIKKIADEKKAKDKTDNEDEIKAPKETEIEYVEAEEVKNSDTE